MGPAAPAEEPRPKASAADLPTAVEQIYEQYATRIYNYCCYHLRDPDRADDAVSRIFEKILLHLDRYDPRRGLLADWLFGIARNAVKDERRRRRRGRTVSLQAVAEREAGGPSPEQSALDGERRRLLMEAVAGLRSREREIMALKFAGGLSNGSIARLCRLSPGNVAVILHRAIRRVRAEVEHEERTP